jgi:hypothetical protein
VAGGNGRVRGAVTAVIVVGLLAALTITTDAPRAGASVVTQDWDARIRPVAKQVERIRGLKFVHPVPIVMAPTPQFKRRWREHQSRLLLGLGPTRRYHEEIVLRAFSLAPPEFSMDDLAHESAAGILAFYDYDGKRIVVRGHTVNVAVKAQVARELTLALQEQRFRTGATLRRLHTIDEIQAYNTLIEGDADRVALAYIQTLSRKLQRKALDPSADSELEDSDVAWPMLAVGGAPYAFGPGLVAGLQLDGGDRAIDRAFRNPPKHQVEAFNPTSNANALRVRVVAPKVREGERKIGPPAPIGATTLYVALANRIDPAIAMLAADAWGGSSAQAFVYEGDPCVRASFRPATSVAAGALVAGLRQWTEADPDGKSSVHEAGGQVTLDACGGSLTGYDLGGVSWIMVPLALRNQIVLAERVRGESRTVSKCVADAVVADPHIAEITASIMESGEPTARQQQDVVSIVSGATTVCKTQPT